MNKIFTEQSEILVNSVLQSQDIFHLDNLPFPVLINEFNIYNNINSVRTKWLFDTTGFYHTFLQYNTFLRRCIELLHVGDNLDSLRQRVAILHSMIECNFDSLVPVHVSMVPIEKNKYIEVDLEDMESIKQVKIIIHPGQTRAQASYFMRDNLKNIFLYLHKEDSKYVKIKTPCTKLDTPKDLLPFYNPYPYPKLEDNNIVVDVFLPGHKDGTKRHGPSNMRILKSNSIDYIINGQKTKNNLFSHPSNSYIADSFIKMNKFCEILFNSDLHVYTNDTTSLQKEYLDHLYELAGDSLKVDEHKIVSNVVPNFWNRLGLKFFKTFSGIYKNITHHTDNYGSQLDNHLNLKLVTDSLNENDAKVLTSLISSRKKYPLNPRDYFFPLFIEDSTVCDINSIEDLKSFVQKNKHRGMFIVLDTNRYSIGRDIAEFIMTIPADYALVRSEDFGVCVVNSEHQYWQSGTNFKEYIYNKKFLNFS